ncbi:MAG: hypothetical protein EG826_04130 [Deltaproteobacteria bacterium]|nr:hypothetical protein [Deltaproteobacteria bacterium]
MQIDAPPKVWSIEFHIRFFPVFLWRRFRSQEQRGTGFHSPVELYIVLAVCIVLIVVGAPSALSRGSIGGWIACGLGAAGAIALVIHSIASAWGGRPSYEDFLAGCFLFFIALGLTVGIFVSSLNHYSFFASLLLCLAGLIIGYMIGLAAGFGLQYLGWLAVLVNGAAYLAIIGMVVVDLVLLSGAIFT